ncbi:non-ribosomal peptide synthetase [Streptomyces pinistramenti]|uniref:non-ribosomal peptide synthetase n=1 Tax=Streptomyces pinistramenti TaxID=2884812 RepID=UPI001D08FBDB|nr:non-ribosomal peptide synthetase [Streptomyces pinistramenti]MCB5909709.1 amino acid adenylation domain-containing protein [Streptomyces pinistramenti]
MNAAAFLADLRRRGITVTADGDRLRCVARRGVLTAEVQTEISAYKAEILRELRATHGIPVADGTRVPLSFGQQRMWLTHRFHPTASSYHLPLHLRLTGELVLPALRTALEDVLRRHSVLRTRYPAVDGGPAVEVLPAAELAELPLVDLTGLPSSARRAASRRQAAALAIRPFDLTTGPMLRSFVFRLDRTEHELVLVRHHIADDGWSLGILLADIAELYRAHVAGTPAEPAPLPVQYGDFAAWQRRRAAGAGFAERLARWTSALDGAPARLELLGRASGPPSEQVAGALRSSLGDADVRKLRHLAGQRRTTLFAVLLTGFGLAVGGLAGQHDLVIGSPVAGRVRPELAGLVGCFVNLLPFRLDLSGNAGFGELLGRVREVVRQGLDDQEVPFERIVEAVHPRRSLAETPLVQAAFAYQNTPAPRVELPGLTTTALASPPVAAKFPLTMTASPLANGVELELEFDRSRIHGATAAEILARTVAVLRSAAADPGAPVPSARPLPPPLATTGDPAAAEGTGCLHHEVERIVAGQPDAVAISCGRRQVTYRELDARADRLAAELRARGCGPESMVGLCAEPSVDLVAGMLGALKAGAAYVPMDPADPPRRRAELARAAGIRLLLTTSTVRHLPDPGADTLLMDGPARPAAATVAPRVRAHPANVAYAVFTSGSTGGPKGVLVSHANVTAVLAACRAALPGPRERHTWAMTHSAAFDFSVWEIWGALTSGARLVLIPPDVVRAPDELWATLLTQRVSVLGQTPSAFRALLPTASRTGPDGLPLALVVLGGESCEVAKLGPWFDWTGDRGPELVNMFGTTETTVHVTARRLRPPDRHGPAASPLGQPIPGQHVETVDSDGRPLPVGGRGELTVGGIGVARGYLGHPALTADRFRPAPGRKGGRRYHTGDLVRVLPGEPDYLGRTDKQLSLRGYRIEPGEIEAALLTHPAVRDCVVAAHGTGERRRLVAYLVAEGGARAQDLTSGLLRSYLSDRLPRHLIPGRSVVLPALPLTRNGKLDEAALPAPPLEPDRPRTRRPATPTERTITELAAEVLGRTGRNSIDMIDMHDNFFDLGGDSLLLTQFHFRIVTAFGLDIPVRQVYQAPDIAALARTVDELRAGRQSELVREALRLAEAGEQPR